MSNIIDVITGSAPNNKNMSAADFFTDNNPNGYCSKASFISFAQAMGANNLKKTELVLEYQSQGFKNNNAPIVYVDKQTQLDCVYCAFDMAGSKQNIKFMVTERMASYIKDVQQAKVKPNFTLADLYNEAVKKEN